MKLFGSPTTRAFRVLWLLEELGLDYEHVPAPPHSDEVRALNPSGKVPVLLVDGEAIADSTAILSYLADREGKLTHPAGTLARARQDTEMQRAVDELEGCLWMAARHTFVLPEERRVPQIKDSLRWEFSRAVVRSADRLGDAEFVAGDRMTIADIVVTHCGDWARAAKFPIDDPRLDAYLDRMRARPAYRTARAAGRREA